MPQAACTRTADQIPICYRRVRHLADGDDEVEKVLRSKSAMTRVCIILLRSYCTYVNHIARRWAGKPADAGVENQSTKTRS